MNSTFEGPTRFHRHHGSNIILDSERVTATRSTSFANALTFSEKPLAPGEIFLVEIEENETGWSGNMRIGLTQMNPNKEFPLPLYALPDLVTMGPSWLYAITKTHNNVYTAQRRQQELNLAFGEAHELVGEWNGEGPRPPPPPPPLPRQQGQETVPGTVANRASSIERDVAVPAVPPPLQEPGAQDQENMIQEALFGYRRYPQVLQREGSLVRTPRSYIKLRALLPSINIARPYEAVNLLATDIGSRIGVMYVPTEENKADMHFIINGEDQGPCARDIPYQVAPIFAVVDVYGSTKRVRVVQLHEVESLQSICRDVILRSMRLSGVSNLPLPKLLKDYLLYNM